MASRRPPSSGSQWPVLVLVAGALVLLGTWVFKRDGGVASSTDATVAAARARADSARRGPSAAANDPRVVSFLSWVDDVDAPADAARAAQHAADGMHRLADAIAVLAVRDSAGGLAGSERLAALDSMAGQIARAPAGSRQGELTGSAFVASAVLLQEMHRRRFPNVKNDVVEMRLAANAIRRGSALGGQNRAIDLFFDRAAIVVRRMSVAP
jgi:hypothetical protein